MERSGAFLPPDTADFKLCSKFHARGSAMAAFSLNVNGQVQNVDVLPDTPLLWVLRDAIGLTGTKFGCGVAQCGACTVFMNGKPLRSCSIPVSATVNRAITTTDATTARHAAAVPKARI